MSSFLLWMKKRRERSELKFFITFFIKLIDFDWFFFLISIQYLRVIYFYAPFGTLLTPDSVKQGKSPLSRKSFLFNRFNR